MYIHPKVESLDQLVKLSVTKSRFLIRSTPYPSMYPAGSLLLRLKSMIVSATWPRPAQLLTKALHAQKTAPGLLAPSARPLSLQLAPVIKSPPPPKPRSLAILLLCLHSTNNTPSSHSQPRIESTQNTRRLRGTSRLLHIARLAIIWTLSPCTSSAREKTNFLPGDKSKRRLSSRRSSQVAPF